jgi:heme-degrading monooxygenase HmoA
MANIVRVFRAVVHPGKEAEFRTFFLDHAVPLLRRHEGLVSMHVGLPREETPQDFMMTTVWSSVEALAAFSGEDWREAVIDPREKHLLARTSVDHYDEASI